MDSTDGVGTEIMSQNEDSTEAELSERRHERQAYVKVDA